MTAGSPGTTQTANTSSHHRFDRWTLATTLLVAACQLTPPPANTGTTNRPTTQEIAGPSETRPHEKVEILGSEPEGAWVRPAFFAAGAEFSAGTAFVCVVDEGESPWMLTAQHLFGPAGGLSQELAWSEMPTAVESARGFDSDGRRVLTAGPPLAIEGAKAMSEVAIDNDIAAFPLRPPTQIHALPLATELPSVLDKVWLVGNVLGVDPRKQRFAAVVVEVSDTSMVYAFDAPLELTATSGAPVVNERGEVVAMNLGGGEQDGKTLGVGNPAPAIRARVRRAQ